MSFFEHIITANYSANVGVGGGGPEPLAVSDLKNDEHSIGGVSKTFAELWEDGATYAPWASFGYPPAVVTPGVGLINEGPAPGIEMYLAALPPLVSLVDLNVGFTVVLDLIINSTGTNFATVIFNADHNPDYDEWYYAAASNHDGPPPTPYAVVYDAINRSDQAISNGFHRLAATLGNDLLALSVDGGAVTTTTVIPATLLNELSVGVRLALTEGRTGIATAVLEKVRLYSKQTDLSVLPALSA